MRSIWKTVLAGVAGMGIGVIGTQVYAQQTKPLPAYIIAEQEILDPAAAQQYRAGVGPTLAAAGAHTLVSGGKTDPIDGAPPKRIAVIAFDSAAAARAWHDGPSRMALEPLQNKAMNERAFIVEGVAP